MTEVDRAFGGSEQLRKLFDDPTLRGEVMATAAQLPESDPRHHTAKIKDMLTDVVDHVRSDIGKVTDPKARALFETTAEVLVGLCTAYEHFEQGFDDAWRKAS